MKPILLIAFFLLILLAGCTGTELEATSSFEELSERAQNQEGFKLTYTFEADNVMNANFMIKEGVHKINISIPDHQRESTLYWGENWVLSCLKLPDQHTCGQNPGETTLTLQSLLQYYKLDSVHNPTHVGTNEIAGRTCQKYNKTINIDENPELNTESTEKITLCLDEITGQPLHIQQEVTLTSTLGTHSDSVKIIATNYQESTNYEAFNFPMSFTKIQSYYDSNEETLYTQLKGLQTKNTKIHIQDLTQTNLAEEQTHIKKGEHKLHTQKIPEDFTRIFVCEEEFCLLTNPTGEPCTKHAQDMNTCNQASNCEWTQNKCISQ